jgi:di/tricarboxylate transporter
MLTAGTHMSPYAIFIVLVLFAQIVSLFISNSTAISVALLVVMAIAPTMSLNVPAYAMGIILGASMGCSCPLSGSSWGISMAAGYKFKDYFKYGILIDALGFIAVVVSVPLIMGLTI